MKVVVFSLPFVRSRQVAHRSRFVTSTAQGFSLWSFLVHKKVAQHAAEMLARGRSTFSTLLACL